MRVIVTDSFQETCEIAGGMLADIVANKPDARLGLATGSSAEGVYPYLIQAYRAGEIDFSNASSINLDEYVGLSPDHPQSYRSFMDKHLFDYINIDKANAYVVSGVGDLEENIREFRRQLRRSPIDVQLLGIGADGHIGFNEPGPVLHDSVHVENLDESTIDANSRFFNSREEVPARAISMGIGDIMRAKKLILIATGEKKAQAMEGLLMNEELNTFNPATMIKMHADATVIIDKELADRIGYGY